MYKVRIEEQSKINEQKVEELTKRIAKLTRINDNLDKVYRYLFPVFIFLQVIITVMDFISKKPETGMLKALIVVWMILVYFETLTNTKLRKDISNVRSEARKDIEELVEKFRTIFRDMAAVGLIEFIENGMNWNPKDKVSKGKHTLPN